MMPIDREWARFIGRAVLDNFGRKAVAVTIPPGPKYCQGGQPRGARQEKTTLYSGARYPGRTKPAAPGVGSGTDLDANADPIPNSSRLRLRLPARIISRRPARRSAPKRGQNAPLVWDRYPALSIPNSKFLIPHSSFLIPHSSSLIPDSSFLILKLPFGL